MFKRATTIVLAFFGVIALSVVFASGANADAPAPGWAVFTRATPTVLPPGGEGELWIYVYNVGGSPTANATVVDTLPPGVTAVANQAYEASCTGTSVVTCTTNTGTYGAGGAQAGAMVTTGELGIIIPVKIAAGVTGTAVNRVTVSGGGAVAATTRSNVLRFGSEAPGLGFAGFDAWFSNADGTIDTQAGSHPYEFTVAFSLNSTSFGPADEFPAGGEARRIAVNLPPGIVGDPQAVPRCTLKEFDSNANGEGGQGHGCAPSTQVGEDVTTIEGIPYKFPLYNLVPPSGVPAQFAFNDQGINIFLNAGVRSGGDYGVTEHTSDLPQRFTVFNSTTIWGVPAEESHNPERYSPLEAYNCGNGCAAGVPATPFLTMPTACAGPLTFSVEMLGTYQDESATATASVLSHDEDGNPLGLSGCDLLGHFNPSISVAPDTSYADTPAGLSVEVKVPQEDEQGLLEPGHLSTADLKDTTVTLPEGLVINPGQATGLVACQPLQESVGTEGPGTEAPATCPSASKVGEDEIETPILAHRLKGNVYILGSDPPNLQLLVTASGEGVNLKLVGDVHLNESTGQLTTTFNETPEVPFTDFKLSFSGGAQAALATPTGCGVYSTSAEFTPWNTPFAPAFPESSGFAIDSGPDGTPCAGSLPFTPTLSAGATTDQAGGYTNFSMLLTRGDGQQRIDGLQFKAPAGLTGFLSHVPLCTNTQAEANTCPEASKIGHAVIEAGPGPYPLVVPEAGQEPAPIYLTEAYGGAPFGLSIVVPLHVGPFTLETQRVRASIAINPYTSQLTVTTNPLPQEVAGIPTDLREVDAVIERPEFMVNPTNCDPQSFSGTAYGTPPPGVAGSNETAAISSHFQVGSCQALKFEPKFSVSASGHNSRVDGASLTAKVSYPSVPQGTDADIGSVKIELPKQLSSRLSTLQKACTSAQFEANPAGCPTASKIGSATVYTPLLPVALTGPAIFVSHGGEAFPTLTIVLQGDGVTVDIVGTTFISKAGITSTTFKTVPDDPFSTFELTLGQGPYSALTANVPNSSNYSLCGQTLTMPTEFVGQNGAVIKQSTPITPTGCTKTKTKTLTRAQKLAKALASCHKDKKGKRAKCEKAARKQYGPLGKKAKKKR